MKTYFYIFKNIMSKNKRQVSKCFLIMLIMSILQVIIPLTMKKMIASIEENGSIKFYLCSIGIYTIMWFVYNLINVKWYKHIDILGEKVLWFIREKIYDVMWNCEYETYSKFDKEYLKNVLFTDVINIYGNIILYSLNIIADFFMILVFLGVSFYLDVKTTILLLAAVVIGFLISLISKPVMAKYSKTVNTALKRDNAINNECVDAIELTKTNGLQDYYKRKSKESIHEFIGTAVESDQKTVFLHNIMSHYHQIMVMVITGFLILNVKTITTAMLVYYIYVTNLIIEKSQAIEDNLYKFMKNMAAFDNIDKILQTEIRANEKGEVISDISEIKFDSASLSYGNGCNVFENKSFTLKKGDAVLIEGKNGSGKSSILKMITGLIAPSGGDIRYNGISFQNINMQALPQNICYLNQEELLLNETMRDYLSIISHKEISQKEYEDYSARVNLQKEDTVITENGKNFSGGEKKKAIIMKLLARKNEVSVILLDEIEAGLDKKSQEIADAIEKELLEQKEKYIIVKISHGNISNRNMYNKVIELR